MGTPTFPFTIRERRLLLEAYAKGGAGEAVRAFRELYPCFAHDGFAEACTRQVIGSAWDFAKAPSGTPKPPSVMQ